MKRLLRLAVATFSLASLALVFPALAHAADGYVTGNVNLRAGPDASYPLVDQIRAGTPVNVQGCTSRWEWCDVIVYGNRGWVAGNFIEYDYRNRPVLLPAYGAQIGIPIISFVIGNYWDSYYRTRPFYNQRTHWYRRPVVYRAPPRPINRPYQRLPYSAVRPRPSSHSQQRPTVSRPANQRPARPNHGSRPPQNNRPPQSTQRPTQNNRPPQQAQRPAQNNRPPQPAQRPASPQVNRQHETSHSQPGKSGQAKPNQRSDKKQHDDHGDH